MDLNELPDMEEGDGKAVADDQVEAEEQQASGEEAESKEERVSPRDEIIGGIIAKRRGEPRGEEGQDSEPEPEPDPEITLKVEGEERRVPRSRVLEAGVRTLQKESAADRRLQEASERLRQLEQREQQALARENQLRQYEQQLRNQAQQQPKPPSPSTMKKADPKLFKKVAETIYAGDEEETAKSLAALVEAAVQGVQIPTPPPPPKVDEQRLVNEAAEKAVQRLELETARNDFAREFSEIAADQRLYNMADQATLQIARDNPTWTPRQVIMEAGNQVRRWLEDRTPKSSTRKVERKQAMDVANGASGRQTPPPPPKPKTRADIVQDMRKARGLPT